MSTEGAHPASDEYPGKRVLLGVLKPQQPLGIAAQDLCLVLGGQRNGWNPVCGGLVHDEGIVHREKNPVNAHFHDAAQQCRVRKVTAGRDPEMLAEVVSEGKRSIAVAMTRQCLVDSPKGKG